ncbi:MAG: PTS sugar transporter subunit IIA [Brevinema sp.]
MVIKNLLTEKAFKIGLQSSDKEGIIKEISAFFASQYGVDEKATFNALWEREQKGSTGLGKGLAVPHARLSSIDSMKLVVVFVKEGRDFDSYDKEATRLFFAALVEEGGHPQDQLDMLRLIVETVDKTDLMASLNGVTTASALRDLVLRRIQEAEV